MEWISVNDELPPLNTNVFAICNGFDSLQIMCLANIKFDGRNVFVWCNAHYDINGDAYYDDEYFVTHWMPLPELPKKL